MICIPCVPCSVVKRVENELTDKRVEGSCCRLWLCLYLIDIKCRCKHCKWIAAAKNESEIEFIVPADSFGPWGITKLQGLKGSDTPIPLRQP